MQHILCYGDSNTWGYFGNDLTRFPYEVRWTGRLERQLGEGFRVIEEGLCSRTIAVEDEVQPYRSGLRYLKPCLMSQLPLEWVILMLGTNDTKCRYHLSVGEIALSMEEMLKEMQSFFYWCGSGTKILLIAPAPLQGDMEADFEMDETSVQKSRDLCKAFSKIAAKYGIEFLDAGAYVTGYQADGCHLSEEGHRQLAEAVYQKLKAVSRR